MRRNYVRDRTQAALTYISEYDATQKWEGDSQYDQQQVRQRLQIVFGKANQVRERIDTALNNDDIHRRRRMMCILELPKRFPQPQNMKDSPVTTWITWIREESNKLIAAIDDEITKRQDQMILLTGRRVESSHRCNRGIQPHRNNVFNRSTNRRIATLNQELPTLRRRNLQKQASRGSELRSTVKLSSYSRNG